MLAHLVSMPILVVGINDTRLVSTGLFCLNCDLPAGRQVVGVCGINKMMIAHIFYLLNQNFMGKYIQLSIPEPCHEDWDKMTNVDKGKFCGACQKKVIDFTNMSDEQLMAFFRKPAIGSTCGRFMGEQLDRNIEIPGKRIPWIKYFFQFALPAFLVSSRISAQGKVLAVQGNSIMVPIDKKNPTGSIRPTEGEKRISGRILDDNDMGVPYASVFIKGTAIGSAADSAGNFNLKYTGTKDCIVLTSSCVGFESVEAEIDLNKKEDTILLRMTGNSLLGEVVVAGFVQTKGRVVSGMTSTIRTTNFVDTISKFFCAKPAFKLYPNPIKGNSLVTMEMNKHQKGSYLIQLSGLAGQVILSKEIWLDENDRLIKLDIPPIAAGVYLINAINKQAGKNNTEKIIIE